MYRTVAQIDSATALLARWFPQVCTRVELPETSVQGRKVFALRLRSGGGPERRGVLLVGGTHARELMNPDALIELAVDLVASRLAGTDVVYGGRTWTAEDVKVILEALDVWILPCSNPDGREYVMTVDDMWRKNRRDNLGTPCDGVDLNRNAELLWGVTEGQTSCDPCSDVYAGPSAASEPETRNVRHLLDAHPVECLVDVHSYSELILYPWGHAPTQTHDPTKRFPDLPTGTCAPIGVPGYQEYMTPRDLRRFQIVGQRAADAIAAVRGRVYTADTGLGLYPTTGTLSDYAYGRHVADPAAHKTYGFTVETGPFVGDPRESFHPADPTLIKRDAKSGLLALVQQSICGFDLIGARLLQRESEVDALRAVRDERLAATEAGRAWIDLFERVQIPLVPVLLSDEKAAAEAAALVESVAASLKDEQAALDGKEIDRAVALLGTLTERAPSDEVRADLQAIGAELEHARSVSLGAELDALTRRAPAPHN